MKSLLKQALAGLAAILLFAGPALATPQDPKPQQPQTQAKQDPAKTEPVQSPDNPDVKKGSKEDVEAIGNRGTGKGINFYSLEKEVALGKQLAQEVERSSKLIDDPVVVDYVNRVGQNLVRNSDARVPFTIKVIDSDEVNAFALPGGFFYVNSGLITIPLILLGPGGWAGYGIYQAANFMIPMAYLKFSRDDERQADYFGLEYMYKAGYDPNSYVTFFERVQADERRRPGSIPKVFSTHPPTPERIQNTQKEIARILPNREQYIVSTSEFDAVKGRLRSVIFQRKANGDPDKPTLRTRTEQQKDKKDKDKTQTGDPSDDDDRPTLKKRP